VSAPTDSYEVVVVGAGLFGASVARECALRGLSVVIVEGGEVAGGASRVGAVLLGDDLPTGGDARALAGLAALAPHLVTIVPMEGGGLASFVDVTRLTQLYVIDAVARGAELLLGSSVAEVEGSEDESTTRTVLLADGRRLEARAVVLATGASASPLGDPTPPNLRRVRIVDVHAAPPRAGRLVDGALSFPTKAGARIVIPTADEESALSALEACGFEGAAIAASDVVEVAVPDETNSEGKRGLARISESGPGAHRMVATYLADLFARAAGRDLASMPRDAALPGGSVLVPASPLAEHFGVPELAVRRLVSRHGSGVTDVLERTNRAPRERALICACECVLECEVRHACRVEGARSLGDVSRRTTLGAGHCNGLDCAHRAAQVVREESGGAAATSNDEAWAFLNDRFDGREPFLGPGDLAREEVLLSRLTAAGFDAPEDPS